MMIDVELMVGVFFFFDGQRHTEQCKKRTQKSEEASFVPMAHGTWHAVDGLSSYGMQSIHSFLEREESR